MPHLDIPQFLGLLVLFLAAAKLCGAMVRLIVQPAVLRVAVPTLLRLLRLDPPVAAGLVALAAADVATLLLYFNLARWLLG